MKTKTLPFILFILFCLFSISCNNDDNDESVITIKECLGFEVEEGTILDEMEYQIIDAVIENNLSTFQFLPIVDKPADIFIGSTILQIEEFLFIQDITLELELIDNYLEINGTPSTWKANFERGELKSSEELKCLFFNNEFPCESFEAKYPTGRGFFSFTRPAFLDEDTAIVEFSINFCDGGRGELAILKFENDRWVVDNLISTFVS